MAKYEAIIGGDFDKLKEYITRQLPVGSATFSFEEELDGTINGKKYWVVACERYGMLSDNRLSLNITLLEGENENVLMATSTGGSRGMVLKFNTISEENFLDTLREIMQNYPG